MRLRPIPGAGALAHPSRGSGCQGCDEGWHTFTERDSRGIWTIHEKPSDEDWINRERVRCRRFNGWFNRHPIYAGVLVVTAIWVVLLIVAR